MLPLFKRQLATRKPKAIGRARVRVFIGSSLAKRAHALFASIMSENGRDDPPRFGGGSGRRPTQCSSNSRLERLIPPYRRIG
jgi:hypothetical protein